MKGFFRNVGLTLCCILLALNTPATALAGIAFPATFYSSVAAGGTSYVNSVQYVTVTIAASATTGTASVSAPTGTYFVSGMSFTSTDTSTDASSMPRITFASNTITATRGTSSSATITCIVVIVDATSNLVKTVQFGTVAIAGGSASNTATISAVTNANTAIVFLGQSTTGSQSYSGNMNTIGLSGTTVTATRQFSGSTETVAFCVIEFQGTALHSSVQNVALNATVSATTATSTITSVNANNSMLFEGGFNGNVTSSPSTLFNRAQLTGSTTITYTFNAATFVNQQRKLCVVEFASGVLASNVQRGTISLSAATSATATVTSVSTTKSIVNYVGNSSTATTANAATSRYRLIQTNATTLTESVNSSATGIGSYEVGEFN